MYLLESDESWFVNKFYLKFRFYSKIVFVFVLGEKEKEVMKYKAGDYFGELALLKDEPRAASIKAKVI